MTLKNIAAACLIAASVPTFTGCAAVAVGGAGAAVVLAEDRRSTGTQMDDQIVETKAAGEIGNKYGIEKAHLNFTSYNKVVLISGEVADEAARQDVERMVRSIAGVRGVQNELVVGPPSSMSARSKDTWVTSKVKTRLLEDKFSVANRVKVVTEAGIVYLMGLVTRAEAERVTQIARTTSDVVKVVRLFEYVD
jgi:osmotically-inducible protein OsmY